MRYFNGSTELGRNPFVHFNGSIQDTWVYGEVNSYSPQAGYDAFFPANESLANVRRGLEELRTSGWVDEYTRGIFQFARSVFAQSTFSLYVQSLC